MKDQTKIVAQMGDREKSQEGIVLNLLKKIVLSKLDKLKYGNLRVINGDEILTFGEIDRGVFAEIKINDPFFFYDVFTKGSIGASESYILKRWDSPNLDNVMRVFALNRTILNDIDSGFVNFIKPVRFLEYWRSRNTEKGAKKNILAHYDLPDELFELFLDDSKMYSSAYYSDEKYTLEQAQFAKLEMIARKLNIRAGDTILEIGTGWGGLAIHLAKNYDCHVTTTTISDRQYEFAKKRIQEEGLIDKITILKEDYRNLEGRYNRIVSIEMIEAVGEKFLGTYLKKISDMLVDDGLVLIQAITINDQEYDRAVKEVDFIKKFIFPGSFIPSLFAIQKEVKNNTDLRVYSQEDFSEHYAKTLTDWKIRFNENSDKLSGIGLDESFQRLWNFYFSYCIGGFKERAIGVSHLVFGKPFFRD